MGSNNFSFSFFKYPLTFITIKGIDAIHQTLFEAQFS